MIRLDTVAQVMELAERFAPNNLWYVKTMQDVLTFGGEEVKESAVHNLMRLIAEGTSTK